MNYNTVLCTNVDELVISSGLDPGKGRHEAVHLAQSVRPHLRVEQHLPPDPPHRSAAAGVQAQVDRRVRANGLCRPVGQDVLRKRVQVGHQPQGSVDSFPRQVQRHQRRHPDQVCPGKASSLHFCPHLTSKIQVFRLFRPFSLHFFTYGPISREKW